MLNKSCDKTVIVLLLLLYFVNCCTSPLETCLEICDHIPQSPFLFLSWVRVLPVRRGRKEEQGWWGGEEWNEGEMTWRGGDEWKVCVKNYGCQSVISLQVLVSELSDATHTLYSNISWAPQADCFLSDVRCFVGSSSPSFSQPVVSRIIAPPWFLTVAMSSWLPKRYPFRRWPCIRFLRRVPWRL